MILVPVGQYVEPDCEEGLRELEKRGYQVRRARGFSAIDAGRNQMASDALAAGFEELMWIDSDVGFCPEDVERLRSHRLLVVAGLYAKKSRREFACSFLPHTETIVLGRNGGLMEVRYVGFGFTLTHRAVFETILNRMNLPVCNQSFPSQMIPWFMPMIHPGFGNWYLAEDYAFCERARLCSIKTVVDTTIRLWHVGSYRFSWEDAGSDKERYGDYTFHIDSKKIKS